MTLNSSREAKVWDAKTGAEVLTLTGHTGVIVSASFSQNGSRIVTASKDQTAKVWDAMTGAEVFTIRGHKDKTALASLGLTSASFSPDGSKVMTASHDGTVKVWDAGTDSASSTRVGATRPALARQIERDGVFGFPQAQARVVHQRDGLRVSVWNNAEYLYVQAVVVSQVS